MTSKCVDNFSDFVQSKNVPCGVIRAQTAPPRFRAKNFICDTVLVWNLRLAFMVSSEVKVVQ